VVCIRKSNDSKQRRPKKASSLAEEKNKLLTEIEELKKEVTRKGEDLIKATDSFKQDVARSYLVEFEAALEQVAVVHLTMDLSELDPVKSWLMVD